MTTAKTTIQEKRPLWTPKDPDAKNLILVGALRNTVKGGVVIRLFDYVRLHDETWDELAEKSGVVWNVANQYLLAEYPIVKERRQGNRLLLDLDPIASFRVRSFATWLNAEAAYIDRCKIQKKSRLPWRPGKFHYQEND